MYNKIAPKIKGGIKLKKSHLDILSTIAFHTDMSCSKTINIPTEYPFEDMKDVYMECWKKGIKGC